MSECSRHKIRVPRDPEQTMLRRSCRRCGDTVMVSIPSQPPGERGDKKGSQRQGSGRGRRRR